MPDVKYSTHLLPLTTGNEFIPISYRGYLPAYNTMYSSVSTIAHYVVYIATVLATTSPARAWVNVCKYNTLTKIFTTVGDIEWTNVGSNVGSILADDTHLYISNISDSYIRVFDLNSLNLLGAYRYSASVNFTAYGKMNWSDDHTICVAIPKGFVFFDTITHRFTNATQSTDYYAYDMSVGDKLCISNRNTNQYEALIYNKQTEAFSTLSMTNQAQTVSCYSDGKFYFAISGYTSGSTTYDGYLMIYDEATGTVVGTQNVPWMSPRSINVSGNSAFVTCTNSNQLYIIDISSETWTYFLLPWTIPTWDSSKTYLQTAIPGYYFLPYISLMTVDYSGSYKYNIGFKYEQFLVMYTLENESMFTYNPDFIEFTDTYVTIKDGSFTYELEPSQELQGMKVAHIDKRAFTKMKSVRFLKGDDGNE